MGTFGAFRGSGVARFAIKLKVKTLSANSL
jgi:hypothetical protein